MIRIISGKHGRTPREGFVIDAVHLPNPYDVPALRPRDGRDALVKDWLLPQIQAELDRWEKEIALGECTAVTTLCNAGRHRSVAVAEELASRFRERGRSVVVHHRELEREKQRKQHKHKQPKVQKTYRHQMDRKRARARMKDGELCWWCNRPMHRDQQLDVDHVTSVHDGGVRADRMLHSVCNRQRREGGPEIDRRRPAAHAADAFSMLPIMLKSGKVDRRYPGEEVKAQVGVGSGLVDLRKPFVW